MNHIDDRDRVAEPQVRPVEAPLQRDTPKERPELVQVDALVRAAEARRAFGVDGGGTTVAVLDTGLRTTHRDFAGRVRTSRNFTADNGGDPTDASDGQGHGTNVAGIICAGDLHVGMAPGAGVIPVKVLNNRGSGSFEGIRDALRWVLANRLAFGITAVCMSLGAPDNRTADDTADLADDAIGRVMADLAAAGVACCVAAGNGYFEHHSVQGMSYPAIFRQTISVGAVYDANVGPFNYGSGAKVTESGPDRITPFSQRLHETAGGECATDIFAPGAPTTSSGINGDSGESVQHGTSQATPVVAGIVLLLQDLHREATGRWPAVADLRRWLLAGAVSINDGDDERDNVEHTGLDFPRVSAFGALQACARELGIAVPVVAAAG